MNLDELRTVQSKERRKDSLQHLRNSFYADVADYISELKAERKRVAAEADDPFSSPEVGRLTDEIETAEEVVEAVYERRVGKVVKLASFAAADMPVDEDGFTQEERALFDDLVARIDRNKSTVLDILSGKRTARAEAEESSATEPADSAASTPTTNESNPVSESTPDVVPDARDAPSDDGVLADAMGGSDSMDDTGAEESSPSSSDAPTTDVESMPARTETEETADEETQAIPPDVPDDEMAADASAKDASGSPDVERTTVRITQDIGSIFGVDEREYDLGTDDVVTLPTANAEPLLAREAAERLD
jgi:DNA replication factor GINS